MKNTRMFWAVVLLFIVAGCRKTLNDNPSSSSQEYIHTQNAQNHNLSNADGIIASDWQSSNSWTKVDLPTHTIFYTHLETAFVDNSPGQQMVRIFKTMSGKDVPQSLPFEETINGTKYYWYYTVTKGSVMIAVDVYGSPTNPGLNHQFRTIAFTREYFNPTLPSDQVKTSVSKLTYEKIDALLTK